MHRVAAPLPKVAADAGSGIDSPNSMALAANISTATPRRVPGSIRVMVGVSIPK